MWFKRSGKEDQEGVRTHGCSKYPECDFVSWDLPVKEPCRNADPTWLKKLKGQAKTLVCSNDQCKYKEEKRMKELKVNVIGGGLAGCEAAWQLANRV